MNHVFTAPVAVWISKHSQHDADSLQKLDSIEGLSMFKPESEMQHCGYTKVGDAEITITMVDRDQIVTGKVVALRAELERDRADSQQRQNALIRKISELEALTYEPAETA